MRPLSERGAGRLIAMIAGLVSFFAYLYTLLPGVGGYGDTVKFQFIGKAMGIPHPSGFPTYLIIDALVSRIPLGNLAWRINLISAVFGALTVYVLCMLTARLSRNLRTTIPAALILAFSFTFWSVCVIAEVYSLSAFLVASTIYSLVLWRETRRRKWLYLAASIYAVSLGNHPTVILMVPSLLFLLLATDPDVLRKPRSLLALAAILLLGACQYLYLLFLSSRNPLYQEGTIRSIGELISFVTGGSYKARYFAPTLAQLLYTYFPIYLRDLLRQVTLPGMALAALGCAGLLRRNRVWGVFLIIYYVVAVVLPVNGPHVEQPIYFIPATLVITIFMACPGLLFSMARGPGMRRLRTAFSAALCAILVFIIAGNYRIVNLRGKDYYGRWAARILKSVKPGGVILSPGYQWTEILLYEILGEGLRAGDGVKVLHHWRPEELDGYLRGQVPNWNPYCPRGEVPSTGPPLYLLATSADPPALGRIRRAGWKAELVFSRESPLVKELHSLGNGGVLLAAVKDEGMTILGDEAYHALQAIGFKERAVTGANFGWAFAAAVAREKERWRGSQTLRYAPVEVKLKRGEKIRGAGIPCPADIEVLCAGYDRGNRNEIRVNGKNISRFSTGMNIAVFNPGAAEPGINLNVPPAEFGRLQALYLYELSRRGE